MSSTMNFTKYNVLGFDMDFTLARYELVPFFNMVYDILCKYLVENKEYPKHIFHKLEEDKDLIYKGLIADFEKGNVLKLAKDGLILRATHGTKMMSSDEVKQAYGEDKKFKDYDRFIDGLKSVDSKWRFFENYFDIPGLVAFARIVDHLHEQGQEEGKPTYEHVWIDIVCGLENMYTPSQFEENKGGFFPEMKRELAKYVKPVSQKIKDWLQSLRKDGRLVFFLTSSHFDFATFIMNHVYGPDWKSYFDINLFQARKPRFFTENKPFVEVTDMSLGEEKKSLLQHGSYCFGNYEDLMAFFRKSLGTFDPKVLYFGDNLWADAWPSKTLGDWDSVLIFEEMDAEGYAVTDGTVAGHEEEKEDAGAPPAKRKRKFEHSSLVTEEEVQYMVSDFWGSVFIDDLTDVVPDGPGGRRANTAFGSLIAKYSDICVPSIEYLAGVPVENVFTKFSKEEGNSRGYHPGRPRSLLI